MHRGPASVIMGLKNVRFCVSSCRGVVIFPGRACLLLVLPLVAEKEILQPQSKVAGFHPGIKALIRTCHDSKA